MCVLGWLPFKDLVQSMRVELEKTDHQLPCKSPGQTDDWMSGLYSRTWHTEQSHFHPL